MPYEVVQPITHLGRSYAKGDPIVLRPQVAHQLMAAGCVREVPPPVPAAPKAVAPLSYRVPPVVKTRD